MEDSEQHQEWQRSSIGITPLTIRPRAGRTSVKKFDMVRSDQVVVGDAEAQGKYSTFTVDIPRDVPAREGGRGGNEMASLSSSSLLSSSSSSRLGAVGAGGAARVCSVCTRASANYSCPRCLIGYCSSSCYKAHGSNCTEAFFREHVERETRLREGEAMEPGGRSEGPKEARRANMVEVLRRVRHGEHSQGSNHTTSTAGVDRGSRSGVRFGEALREGEESGDEGEDGELVIQQERLEALALALKARGHALEPRSSSGGVAPSSTVSVDHARELAANGNVHGGYPLDNGGRGGGGGSTIPLSVDTRKASRSRKSSHFFPTSSFPARRPSSSSSSSSSSTTHYRVDGAGTNGLASNGKVERERTGRLGQDQEKQHQQPSQWLWEDPAPSQQRERDRRGGQQPQEKHQRPERQERGRSHDLDQDPEHGGRVQDSGEKRDHTKAPQRQQEQQERRRRRRPQQQQQLQQLRQRLLRDDEGMLDLLTEEEMEKFLRDVASGRLGKLIVPWQPWWTKSAGVQEVTTTAAADGGHNGSPSAPMSVGGQHPSGTHHLSGGEQRASSEASAAASDPSGMPADVLNERSCTRHTFSALLSRVLNAPDLSAISAKQPSPTLPALASDIAFSYALSARLYNGCWCSDPVEASLTLVGASPVLRDGATPATVGQALAACVQRAVEGEGAGARSYAESLREDVLLLCSDARKLICAFQDAWGMLEAAGRTLAPSAEPLRLVNGMVNKKAQRRAAKELGKVEKRLGYFLLWARSHAEEVAPRMMAEVEASKAMARPQEGEIELPKP